MALECVLSVWGGEAALKCGDGGGEAALECVQCMCVWGGGAGLAPTRGLCMTCPPPPLLSLLLFVWTLSPVPRGCSTCTCYSLARPTHCGPNTLPGPLTAAPTPCLAPFVVPAPACRALCAPPDRGGEAGGIL